MTDHPRYRVEQADDGRWLIRNHRYPYWVWAGESWAEDHPVSFPDQAAAERYAKELFSQPE